MRMKFKVIKNQPFLFVAYADKDCEKIKCELFDKDRVRTLALLFAAAKGVAKAFDLTMQSVGAMMSDPELINALESIEVEEESGK